MTKPLPTATHPGVCPGFARRPRAAAWLVVGMALGAPASPVAAGTVTSPLFNHAAGTLVSDGSRLLLHSAYAWAPGAAYSGYDQLEIYDPATDAWHTAATVPGGGSYAAGAVLNNVFYAIGGEAYQWNVRSSVYGYDTQTDQWSTKASYPEQVFGHAAAALNGKIYSLGGQNGWLPDQLSSNTVYEYDPATDRWTQKAALPFAVRNTPAQIHGGKLYVFGGVGANGQPQPQVQIYDPVLNQWSLGASMPAAAFPGSAFFGFLASVVSGDQAYVFSQPHNQNDLDAVLDEMFVYDFANDSWTMQGLAGFLPLDQISLVSGAALIDNRVYFMGREGDGWSNRNEPSTLYTLELVPAPAPVLLLGAGLIGLVSLRRGRRTRALPT